MLVIENVIHNSIAHFMAITKHSLQNRCPVLLICTGFFNSSLQYLHINSSCSWISPPSCEYTLYPGIATSYWWDLQLQYSSYTELHADTWWILRTLSQFNKSSYSMKMEMEAYIGQWHSQSWVESRPSPSLA